MSELDKDKVMDEFTKAYQASQGKKPKVDENNGWYSVDGSKNMRLAQLDEWTKELKKEAKTSAKKAPAKASTKGKKTDTKKKTDAKKKSATTKKKTSTTTGKSKDKSASKSLNSESGQNAAELWKQRLAAQASSCRLPRGVR